MLAVLAVAVLAQVPAGADANDRFFDSVVAGRTCSKSSLDGKQGNCTFKVQTATFEIAGVGAPDAQLAIYSADIEKTWVAFMLASQCIAVKRPDVLLTVYVSPKNAKVYRDWVSCRAAAKNGK